MPARFGTATPTTGVTMSRAAVSSTPGLELDAIGSGYRLAHASGRTRGTCRVKGWDELRAVKLIGFVSDALRVRTRGCELDARAGQRPTIAATAAGARPRALQRQGHHCRPRLFDPPGCRDPRRADHGGRQRRPD